MARRRILCFGDGRGRRRGRRGQLRTISLLTSTRHDLPSFPLPTFHSQENLLTPSTISRGSSIRLRESGLMFCFSSSQEAVFVELTNLLLPPSLPSSLSPFLRLSFYEQITKPRRIEPNSYLSRLESTSLKLDSEDMLRKSAMGVKLRHGGEENSSKKRFVTRLPSFLLFPPLAARRKTSQLKIVFVPSRPPVFSRSNVSRSRLSSSWRLRRPSSSSSLLSLSVTSRDLVFLVVDPEGRQ